MLAAKVSRARETMFAFYFLVKVRRLYRRGNESVARATAEAMRRVPAAQEALDSRNVPAWQVARSTWRAKRWLPFHSTCLQTALATQMLFDRHGIDSVVRIGVQSAEADAHAWVEVGDFVLDDQRIANCFSAFELARTAPQAGDA